MATERRLQHVGNLCAAVVRNGALCLVDGHLSQLAKGLVVLIRMLAWIARPRLYPIDIKDQSDLRDSADPKVLQMLDLHTVSKFLANLPAPSRLRRRHVLARAERKRYRS